MTRGGLLGYFARHPVAANLLMLSVLCLGASFAPRLSNTLTPDVVIPALEVEFEWPGADAETVSSALLEPVEARIRRIDGVRSTIAHASPGRAALDIVLDYGAEPAAIKQDVAAAIDATRDLPAGLLPPRIALAAFDERVMRLGLTGAPLAALYDEATRIRSALLELGVPRVDIDGWAESELEIGIDSNALRQLGVSLDGVAEQLRAGLNVNVGGRLQRDGDDLLLRSRSLAADDAALQNLPLVAADGATLRLGDVASVAWRQADARVTRINGQDGVALTLYRSPAADTIAVSSTVRGWLNGYRPEQRDSRLQVIEDASATVRSNRNMLIGNAVLGLLIVFAVLYVVLGARTAIWTAVGIPVVVAATLLAMLATGHSINMITVAAFIMVLGVIVDDAIVVSEESDALAGLPSPPAVPSLAAARRMASPVTASALTTIVAFAPLLFLPGYFGAMLAPIAIVVIAAILASLFECLLILPAHLRGRAAADTRRPQIGARALGWLHDRWALPAMRAAVARPGRVLGAAFVLLLLSTPATVKLFHDDGMEIDDDTVRVIVYLEPATPHSERTRIARHVEDALRTAAASLAGDEQSLLRAWSIIEFETTGNPWLETVVSLSPGGTRTISSGELLKAWGRQLQPDSWVRRYGLEIDREKPLASISWRLSGPVSLAQLRAAGDEFVARLQGLPQIGAVENSFDSGARQIEFELGPQGRALGLDEAAVARQLHAGIEGVRLGQLLEAGRPADIRLRLPADERERLDRIAQFPLQLPGGGTVPLWSVATLRQQPAPASLVRSNGRPELTITAHLQPSALAARAELRREVEATIVADLNRRYGLQRSTTPMERERDDVVAALLEAFFIGSIGIYLLMAWVLRSFVWPLLIVAVIPLGIVGAVFAHLLTGLPLGVLSVFGILGMSGVVVNDAIIYLVRYRELRGRLPVAEAAVGAGSDRFRAIMLTTATTVLGTVPLLLDSSPNAAIFKPLLVSFGGGLIAGSLLMLLVLPSLLCWLDARFGARASNAAAVDAVALGKLR